jgi:hypothetical protein
MHDRVAGTEQGARDFFELCQRRFVSVALLLSASDSAAEPASPVWLASRLLRGEEGEGCSTGPSSRARATYVSDVRVALLLSASDSAAVPASPILLLSRLQRGVEGQGCSTGM